MGRKSEGRKKQRRETGENTNTGYLSRAFCSRAPNHCFSTLSMRYFLNPPPSAPISLLFLSFSPSSSFSSSEQRGSAWMEETCRPKNSSHVARRRQAARVARLFRKRICTFEKRGVTREPARWFDKENGRGGCDGERRINVACHRTDREDTRREGLPYASLPTEHFPDGWEFLLPTVSLSPKIFGKRYTFASLFFSFFLLLTFTSNKI